MDERAFYNEKEEVRKVKLICPSCRGEFEAPVRWKVCRKKKELQTVQKFMVVQYF